MRLHYARCGEGPLMLFLHGFPEFWRGWKKPLEYFGARGWCAVAPDQRGYNLSDRPAAVEQYRAKLLIEDIRQLAQRFGGGRFVLVAHDWGGAVAWGFAMAHPELLSQLVIVNSPHPYTFWRELSGNPAQQQASAYMLLLRDAKAERVLSQDGYAKLWQFAFGWGTPQFSDEDKAAYIEAWAQPGALTGSLNWYRASPLYPPTRHGPRRGAPAPGSQGFHGQGADPGDLGRGRQGTAARLPRRARGLRAGSARRARARRFALDNPRTSGSGVQRNRTFRRPAARLESTRCTTRGLP